jgi:drug/metabolite transporter (DMT)-like permease
MHPIQLQFIQGIAYAAMLPFWFGFIKKTHLAIPTNTAIMFAAIYTIIYISSATVFNYLIKDNNIGSISALTALSPAITISLSFMFLGEQLTTAKLIAFVLALISTILINY